VHRIQQEEPPGSLAKKATFLSYDWRGSHGGNRGMVTSLLNEYFSKNTAWLQIGTGHLRIAGANGGRGILGISAECGPLRRSRRHLQGREPSSKTSSAKPAAASHEQDRACQTGGRA
jgi:hypothetical protein